MRTECKAFATVLDCTALPALGPTETSAAVRRVRCLERPFFDESDRPRRDVTGGEVESRGESDQSTPPCPRLARNRPPRWVRWPN